MAVYLALFRGINVSGYNIIKMEHLRKLMADNGYTNVQTYIQSGNVVFATEENSKDKIANAVQALLQKEYGYTIEVFILNEADLTAIIDNNPYTDNAPEPSGKKKYHVVFLSDKASDEGINKLNEFNRSDDEFTVIDKVMYLKLAQSAADSKLTNALIENKLDKCKATTRNWNTTLKMLDMMQKHKL